MGDQHFFIVGEVGYENLFLVSDEDSPLTKGKNLSINSLKKEKFIICEKGLDTGEILEKWL
ncbi:hypothetical protein FD46_GL000760 [Liquorilactobacillus oeni DSM 19972]|uniref:Uncharacterized protein n=1 Tax=Liquorilactobacillus oeni DSM 19972 TaxID=1423777 RepID=A0A0R1MB59_9LACO|nr:hypothetical protein FD46_GL000760 [Liquorilactobacillus oeni DSM 19972]